MRFIVAAAVLFAAAQLHSRLPRTLSDTPPSPSIASASVEDARSLRRQPLWVTAYYTVWGVCDLPPEQIDWNAVTHIIHQNLEPVTTGRLWNFPRAFQDDDRLYFERGIGAGCGDANVQEKLIRLAHSNNVKVLLGLGGVGKGAEALRYITMDAERLQIYVDNVLQYAHDRGYDGVDLDWEYVETRDQQRFVLLVNTLRQSLDNWIPRGLLTLAIPGWTSSRYGYDITAMNSKVDQVNLMTYDMANQWSSHSGFNAPLFRPHSTGYDGLDIHSGVQAWIGMGLHPHKLGLGIPFFGYIWKDSEGPGLAKRSNAIYQISYRDINEKFGALRYQWDDSAKVPWLSGTDASGAECFVSFENEASVQYKVKYALDNDLGGVMIFELWRGLSRGTDRQPLMTAVKEALSLPR
jgi:chitinase